MNDVSRTPSEIRAEAAWVLRLGSWGARAMWVIALLALVFTMVNVQTFAAADHPVDSFAWWIAWLLDPMASLTMGTAIVFEGLLAEYGRKVEWLTATKWYAGIATWAMNIWGSVVDAVPSGVVLHSVAPGLVLLLAEAAPRVRRHLAEIVTQLERRAADADERARAQILAEAERAEQRREQARAQQEATLAALRAEHEQKRSPFTPAVATPPATEPPRQAPQHRTNGASAPRNKKAPVSREQRRQWVRQEHTAGRNPTGADVDRRFGPPRTGAAIVAEVNAEPKPTLHAVGGKSS